MLTALQGAGAFDVFADANTAGVPLQLDGGGDYLAQPYEEHPVMRWNSAGV